ncbi:FKBP-type peptidyl-prolyl cis-trans isomerase [Massilia norwichensis]|jgi:FKBP-type peptidyl-prolyl cis-trans isomerase FkpA|uniref:Peptidyl-prolyl cis-trans isomerase n=1 Tax=Massilia norwichensis TaxID=1442366 RepID=A0ABT2AA39_9BURK|nr:FKBP-type peptidyl-prolyl cis-trans isomerase [Massilia norwichensis]MCS0591056.1 FKBP-type peptidyl-prolyl cis-trans isomerase [Massilia norwichensis]
MKLLSFPLAAAFAAVLSLTACGGGGGDAGSGNGGLSNATIKIASETVGTGTATAATGNRVLVNYTGWLYSTTATGNKGTQFDTSAVRGPYELIVGGNVIPGFSQAVQGMKVGGKRTVVIPAVLGYGSAGTQGIPPNSDLVFDVELLKICATAVLNTAC